MVDTIGVHRSVNEVFQAEALESHLASADCDVRVVGDDTDWTVDLLVTLEYDPGFPDRGIEWIHSIQSGVDRFPTDRLREQDVTLTSSAGIHREVVGETVLGYMLHFARRFDLWVRQQADPVWDRPPTRTITTLSGRTVAVVGTGTLGSGVAAYAEDLGMDVIGVNRGGTAGDAFEEVRPTDQLDAVLAAGEFVVLAVPLTEATHGLISADELERIGPEGYLINVARGAVVDEEALDRALRADVIAGAAIDVASTEPLPESSPLWERENLLITPHIAGVWEGYHRRVGNILEDNLVRHRSGEALVNREV
jgi:D-2-hydroxyacid dehydrogenase (NADP+)